MMRLRYIDKEAYDQEMIDRSEELRKLSTDDVKTLILYTSDGTTTNRISLKTLLYIAKNVGVRRDAAAYFQKEVQRLKAARHTSAK